LLWTTSGYKFKGVLGLSAAQLGEGTNPLGFEITTSKEHLCCIAKDLDERASWLHDLDEQNALNQETRQKQRSRMKTAKTKYASARDSIHSLITNKLESVQGIENDQEKSEPSTPPRRSSVSSVGSYVEPGSSAPAERTIGSISETGPGIERFDTFPGPHGRANMNILRALEASPSMSMSPPTSPVSNVSSQATPTHHSSNSISTNSQGSHSRNDSRNDVSQISSATPTSAAISAALAAAIPAHEGASSGGKYVPRLVSRRRH